MRDDIPLYSIAKMPGGGEIPAVGRRLAYSLAGIGVGRPRSVQNLRLRRHAHQLTAAWSGIVLVKVRQPLKSGIDTP